MSGVERRIGVSTTRPKNDSYIHRNTPHNILLKNKKLKMYIVMQLIKNLNYYSDTNFKKKMLCNDLKLYKKKYFCEL